MSVRGGGKGEGEGGEGEGEGGWRVRVISLFYEDFEEVLTKTDWSCS